MTAAVKRKSDWDPEVQQGEIKRHRANPFWNKEQLDLHCDPTFLTDQILNNADQLMARMQELYATLGSPESFSVSFPSGLSEEEGERFFSVAREAKLFNAKTLNCKNGHPFLPMHENSCMTQNRRIAYALAKSGMFITTTDIEAGVKLGDHAVMKAMVEGNLLIDPVSIAVILDTGNAALVDLLEQRHVIPFEIWKQVFFVLCTGKPILASVQLLLNKVPHLTTLLSPLHRAVLSNDLANVRQVDAQLENEDRRREARQCRDSLSGMFPLQMALFFRNEEMIQYFLDRTLVITNGPMSREIPVSSALLSLSSRYFARMFLGGVKESGQQRITIQEENVAQFCQLLQALESDSAFPDGSEDLAVKYGLTPLSRPISQPLPATQFQEGELLLDKLVAGQHIDRASWADPQRSCMAAYYFGIQQEILMDKNLILWRACCANNLELVRLLLKKGAAVKGFKCLEVALARRNRGEFLVSYGGGAYVEGFECLEVALAHNNLKMTQLLFQHGALPREETIRLALPLSEELCLEMLKRLPEARASFSWKTVRDKSEDENVAFIENSIERAEKADDEAKVRFYTRANRVVNGRTPLHRAAAQGNLIRCVTVLHSLEEGPLDKRHAFLNTVSFEGKTAAACADTEEIMLLLLDAGADPTLGTTTPLHRAAERGWRKACRKMILEVAPEKRAFLNKRSPAGRTALQLSKNTAIGNLLLDAGADLSLDQEITALHTCIGLAKLSARILDQFLSDPDWTLQEKMALLNKKDSNGLDLFDRLDDPCKKIVYLKLCAHLQ